MENQKINKVTKKTTTKNADFIYKYMYIDYLDQIIGWEAVRLVVGCHDPFVNVAIYSDILLTIV